VINVAYHANEDPSYTDSKCFEFGYQKIQVRQGTGKIELLDNFKYLSHYIPNQLKFGTTL
jgi:hypothetical protein